jgi:isoleucyl-tRNA synthetase
MAANLSAVAAAEDERIIATPSAAQKCERCWHYVESIGSHAEHPTLCGRCVSNLFGDGETRAHA